MKKLILLFVAIMLLSLTGRMEVSAQETDGELQIPSENRMDLEIPDEIWDQVRENVGYEGRPLGYTADEMSHFKGSDCVMRTISRLFRDIRSIPRLGGRFGDAMLGDPENFASATFSAYRLLDVSAARVMDYPALTGWDVDWIEEGASIDEAFESVLTRNHGDAPIAQFRDEFREQWDELPDVIKQLVVRMLIASIEATPWIIESFDEDFYLDYFDVDDLGDITSLQLYEFASWPWQDEAADPTPRECFEALDKFDMRYFATGSNSWMTAVYGAIEEYQVSVAETDLDFGDFGYCEFETVAGTVGIFGEGEDRIEGEYSLVIDLGGDDYYAGRTATPRSLINPVSVVIDLAGDEKYCDEGARAGVACGNHGIGAILDLQGNDIYESSESGIACAWYGTGLIVDYAGRDEYTSHIWGQGAAHAGVGMLIDIEGNDSYICDTESQAFGSTYGAGIIVDVAGDDNYLANPEGNISETFEGRSVSFAQGTGFGRRADFYDGHSLGGGWGILVDGGGDDVYGGSVYSQGAGYWWAVGILEDRGGNDIYTNEQYSCGSAPHFAIGCLVDFTGDDKYNVGYEDVERQIQGHARDGSIAVFIDGSGNDEYFLPNLAAGSSDLNCLTLFWDRTGNDIYTADRNPPRGMAISFGDSTRYSPFHTFRDEMASIGIFLDTGGIDVYSERDPEDEEAAANLTRIPFGENSEWIQRDDDPNYGYGLDIGLYGEPMAEVEEGE